MRSRFTAYASGAVEHLYRTTHPENEAVLDSDHARFARQTLAYCRNIDFTRLTVHRAWPEDEAGIARVHFTAEYTLNGQPGSFSERSEFVRLDGKWVYLGTAS